MNVAITTWEYLSKANFDEQKFEHIDSRLMDKQTKLVISVARQLYTKAKGNEIPPKDLGIVLSCETGPIEAIKEYNSILKEKGYVGVNPSKFPNIMSATPLARISIDIGAKGPCLPLLTYKTNKHALIYATEQIKAGRCRAMIVIFLYKKNGCLGCFIESEASCLDRNIDTRLIDI